MNILSILNPLLSLLSSGVLLAVWQRDRQQEFTLDIAVWYTSLAPIPFLFEVFSSTDVRSHYCGSVGLALCFAIGHSKFVLGVRGFATATGAATSLPLRRYLLTALFCIYLIVSLSPNPTLMFGIFATSLVAATGTYACFKLWRRGGSERFMGLLLIAQCSPNIVIAVGGEAALPVSLATSIFFRVATAFAFVMAALSRSASRVELLQKQQMHEKVLAARQVQDALKQANGVLESRVTERTNELAGANVSLTQANGQLQETLAALQQTQVELVQKEKLASLGRMVAGIAHELNTPIGNALTVSSTMGDGVKVMQARVANGQLKKSDLDGFLAEGAEATALLQSSLSRASGLIENFREVARDNSAEAPVAMSLSLLLADVAARVRPELESISLRWVTDIASDIEVTSCPGQISQVIFQLIENAKIHAFVGMEPGEIRLVLREECDYVEIEVSDTGRGISPEFVNRIFDPFFTTRMGRSLGLGLNNVHSLITRRLGGKIQVSSVTTLGTRFLVQLPKLVGTYAGDHTV